jgi:hypothetical protein
MKNMKFMLSAMLLVSASALGQEFPRVEAGFDYTYVRYAPSAAETQGLSLNGGGGSAVYNINEYLGIKMDLQGYGSSNITWTGSNGNVLKAQGNLFTYLFGPQVKFRTPKVQPFAHLLFGGAHSNVYGNIQQVCTTQPLPGAGCPTVTKTPAGDAFAMAFGGGVDIPIGHKISFRPAEIDYLLTDFSNQYNGSNQNNFRYSAGINFNFGGVSP